MSVFPRPVIRLLWAFAVAAAAVSPFGAVGGIAYYLVVALGVVLSNGIAAFRTPTDRFLYGPLAVAAAAFGGGQFLYFDAATEGASTWAFMVAYIAAAGAAVVVVQRRMRELSVVSVLEAGILVVGAVGVSIGLGLLVADDYLPGATLYASLPLALLGGLAVLGRSRATPAMRWYFVSMVLAVLVEAVEGAGLLGEAGILVFSSTALMPLIFVTFTSSSGVVHIERGSLTMRRQLTARHVVGVAVFFVAVPSVLAIRSDLSRPGILLAYASYLGFVALLMARFWLLIRERDEDHEKERVLRRLGEQLVMASTIDEIVPPALRSAHSVVPEPDLWVGRVEPGGSVRHAHSTLDAPRPSPSQLDVLLNSENDDVPIDDRWLRKFAFQDPELGALVVSSPSRIASVHEPYVQAVAAQLELALTTAKLRETHHEERANRKFRSLVQDTNDVVLLVDADTMQTTLVSPTVERLLKRTESEFVGRSPFVFLAEADAKRAELVMRRRSETQDPIDVRVRDADGQLRWFAMHLRDMSHDDELGGVVVSFSDLHARKMAEMQVAQSERRYRSLIEESEDVFAIVADDMRLTYVSPNVRRLLGYEAADLIGTNVSSIVTEEYRSILEQFESVTNAELDGRTVELEVSTKLGDRRSVVVTISDSSGEEDGAMITIRDVTERREFEASMREAAYHDPLTGLLNRGAVPHELNRYLQKMGPAETTGVLHLDIRDFKVVNESLGFEVGDLLLTEVASRLRSVLRAEDTLARLGGDAFVVLTLGSSSEALVNFAGRLTQAFAEPFEVGGRSHHVAAAIGIASTTDRRETATALLEAAALALRTSKDQGGGTAVYEPWMREAATERFELEADLLPALAAGQFSIAFQPLLLLASNRVRGVESLLRWEHPVRGPVSPGTFIPLAEKSGAITELGRWVLDMSCRQLARWHEELPDARGLGISVNVSARQLEDASEFDVLHDIICSSGVDPRALTLELTETTMLDGVHEFREQLERFRSLGIAIAVDDFGAGTAGLNHLRDVPFDVLKVDKSYVDRLGREEGAYALLSGVVDLAHSMDAIVVAEGIETPEQAELLRRMGCDVGQGFYLGRPMDQARLESWFAKGRAGEVASQIQAPSL